MIVLAVINFINYRDDFFHRGHPFVLGYVKINGFLSFSLKIPVNNAFKIIHLDSTVKHDKILVTLAIESVESRK